MGRFPRLAKYYSKNIKPSCGVNIKFEDGTKDKVKVVDNGIHTLLEHNVFDAMGSGCFVQF